MRVLILALLTAFLINSTNAQKLPAIQQTSLRPPASIKIDGKAGEWINFEANNPATDLLYSIANDGKKLYIVAQTSAQSTITRIVNGGIKLVIQKTGAKNDEGAPFIKFPFMQKGERVPISFSKPPIMLNGEMIISKNTEKPVSKEEAVRFVDSLMMVNNKALTSRVKFIRTGGFAGLDEQLPIYNEKGIEAALSFDNKKALTYELAIDLNLLGLSAAKAEKFSYHLIVNGEPNKYAPPSININPANPNLSSDEFRELTQKIQALTGPAGATTDFWGEYTLAK
nr:hypothetical protein [uncultured Mucilaginibacter sp.]